MIYLNHDFFFINIPPSGNAEMPTCRIASQPQSELNIIIKSFSYFQLFLIPEPFRLFFLPSPLVGAIVRDNYWYNKNSYKKAGFLVLQHTAKFVVRLQVWMWSVKIAPHNDAQPVVSRHVILRNCVSKNPAFYKLLFLVWTIHILFRLET